MWLHVLQDSCHVTRIIEAFEAVRPGQNSYVCFSELYTEGCRVFDSSAHFTRLSSQQDFVKLIHSRTDWEGIIFNTLRPEYWSWLRQTGKMFLNRVDIFVSQLREEYDLFRQAGMISPETSYHFGIVGLLENNVPEDIVPVSGYNILLGNSASASNNHLDAIDYLSRCNLEGHKVIVPLTYGNVKYRDTVIQYGREKLGHHFEPMTKHLDLDEFQKVMNSCGFVIMNQLRQQALGTILLLISKGARIFMNDTVAYQCYKKWGLSVERFTDDLKFDHLKDANVVNNDQRILKEHLGRPFIMKQMDALLK